MIYGADVSNWQGSYSWPSGLQFGFAKATEGTTFTDGQFAHNWAQMKSKGLVRGAYHFAHPANDPVVEAEHFLTVVRARSLADGDLLALDLEANDGRTASAVAAWAKTWCTHVQQRTGIRPILYTYLSFAEDGYCAGLGAYPLWIADPSSAAGKPRVAGPWKDWAIHQYSDSPYDKDISHLTAAQLRALGGSTTPEDEVPEYVSVGATKPQDFPAGEWTTIEFDKEYADANHNHADAGGSSVITGPAKYSLTCFVKISGLPVGTEGQIRLTRVSAKDGSDRQPGPIQEFTATSGDQYVTYAIPVDSIDDGRKTRIEAIQWGKAAAKIASAQCKGLVWA